MTNTINYIGTNDNGNDIFSINDIEVTLTSNVEADSKWGEELYFSATAEDTDGNLYLITWNLPEDADENDPDVAECLNYYNPNKIEKIG